MLIDAENYKDKFVSLIEQYEEFAIVPHYNPDPDALGSSFAMQYLLQKKFNKVAKIYFSGIIGRAENKVMINLLDIPIVNLNSDPIPDLPLILMDTQPNTGNNPLKTGQRPFMIFDHHPIKEKSSAYKYSDIRLDFGSTSTIMFDYLRTFDLKPTVNVSTALYYGIQTDVVGEGRKANKIDFQALEFLSKYINREKLYSIENPKLPFDYYTTIYKGLKNGVIYNDFIISSLGEIENPDYIGEIADFLVRFDKAFYVMIMGICNDTIQISFRSQRNKIDAGFALKKIVGKRGTAGGHIRNAGGRIPIEDVDDIPKISKALITKALNLIQGKITTGIPLLSMSDYLNY